MPKHVFIFDTVALANFLLADAAGILTRRYSGRAVITEQVFDELASGIRTRPRLKSVDSQLAQKQFSIITMAAKEHARYTHLIDRLGRGEASCIAAAAARGYTMVTDDRAARSHCCEAGIPVTGSVGIFKAACQSKQLDASEANRILRVMIDKGFYSPARRISDLL